VVALVGGKVLTSAMGLVAVAIVARIIAGAYGDMKAAVKSEDDV
jgi:hypothetical protein